nr:PREDICTED: uncharacterized protein LOC105663087 [Megachile rotundata]
MALATFLLAIHQLNYTEYLTSINQPIRELLTTSKSSDVLFIVHDPTSNNSEIIEDMYRIVVQTSPTTFVYLNRSDTNLSFHVSRRTLIFYLFFSKSSPNVNESQEIANVISREETRQKVLLMTFLEERDCNFESLFVQLWRKQLINVAILELPRFENKERQKIMLHRYNPFSKDYDRQVYTSGIEFFPDKAKNLHGNPMKILLFPRAAIPAVITDSQGRVVKIRGPDAKMLNTFSKVLNFTPNMYKVPTVDFSLHGTMAVEDIDISLSLPIFSSNMSSEYTLPLHHEHWCAVVPISYTSKLIETQAIIGTVVNYVIVLSFWAISRMLKLDRRYWQPLKIFGMILCLSVPIKSRRAIERILLFAIFLASSVLSTNLYADLTTSHIKGSEQTVYKDFKDIEDSGLIPQILKPVYNVTFKNNDDPYFVGLKKKTVPITNMSDCFYNLARYKNVTCFMERKFADVMIYSYWKKGENSMVVCSNLCYAKPLAAYYTKKNSPVVEKLSLIVMRLKQSGLQHKWNMDFTGKFSVRKTHLMNVNDDSKPSLVGKLIPIVTCGFFLSMVVFWAELLVGGSENEEE